MSQQNEKVLLIDANLRKPSTHFIFNITNSVGLTDVLTGKTTFERGCHTIPKLETLKYYHPVNCPIILQNCLSSQ